MRQTTLVLGLLVLTVLTGSLGHSQSLLNVDFGVGERSARVGPAATGQRSNDFWNLHSHYRPRFVPGQPLVANRRSESLHDADGAPTGIAVAVTNAPGVWGNASGDAMWDTYIYAPNGSPLGFTVSGLPPGRYQVFLYGHADADVAAEQNSVFTVSSGTNHWGPLAASGGSGWKVGAPLVEGTHYVTFRDVLLTAGHDLTVEVAPGSGGIAVLNGLQILSRGTSPPRLATPAPASGPGPTNLSFREIRYVGRLHDREAHFTTTVTVESAHPQSASGVLFEGDLAIVDPKLPPGWQLQREGRVFRLSTDAPGRAELSLELLARVAREEPWNRLLFTGPTAAVATLEASAAEVDTEVQVLRGTALGDPATGMVRAALGTDRQVSLRWQSRAAEVTRQALVTADTLATWKVTPTAIRQVTRLRYEVLQGSLVRARVALPPGSSLTRLEGDQISDWQVTEEGATSILNAEFLKPVDRAVELTLISEQAVESPGTTTLVPVQPLGVQRESGSLGIATDDVVLQVESTENLRQVNAPEGQVAAFRFHGRPASARVRLERLLPEVVVHDSTTLRVDETRVTRLHRLNLQVTQAGIYGLELVPPPGDRVIEVRAPGLEGWKFNDGHLHLTFNRRILGDLLVEVELERGLTQLPPTLEIVPLRVIGAAQESARVAVKASAGLRVKTGTLTRAREIPAAVDQEEILAYRADQGGWSAVVGFERLAARIVAEVFNLVTIGDGSVGGSATIRYGLINQGVQEFRLRVPAHWRNVEFTGPGIRRKDLAGDVWTIGLHEKAWSGYPLVVTYDYQFEPRGAVLDIAGAHPLEVERETGYVAVTMAAGLAIEPGPVAEPLRVADPAELPEADRALITRPVLLAYRYSGSTFALGLRLTRHAELGVLDAVVDRTHLTTVLTDAGELLTQAGFMVKNNDRQVQRFRLPADANLWGVYVNGDPVKAERDGEWLMVSLPQAANRDQTFAIDLKYAQKTAPLGRFLPQTLALAAPTTDVPSTYAEWELFVPDGRRLGRFGGTMVPLRGTTYGFRDAWDEFIATYRGLWLDYGAALVVGGGLLGFIVALAAAIRRHGFGGLTAVLIVFALIGVLASMLLPALSKAKAKATTIKSVNNLKQIGIAARVFSTDNGDRLPPSFDAMRNELGSESVLINPDTGRPYVYLGANRDERDPDALLAYGETSGGRYAVVLVDGSVQILSAEKFQDALQRSVTNAPAAVAALSPELARRYDLAPGNGTPGQPSSASAAQTIQREVAAAADRTPGTMMPAATPAGLRSIRIEVPRTGRPYQFTKVLNLESEPLRIEGRLMRQRVWTMGRMMFEVSAFLTGLGLVAWTWFRTQPRAWALALGTGLVLVSAASLFIAWRALHLVLIWGAPVLVFLLVGNFASGWWRAYRRRRASRVQGPVTATGAVPPAAVATVVAWLSLGFGLENPSGAAASIEPDPATPSIKACVVSGSYTGTVAGTVARLEAILRLQSTSTNQTLRLFGEEVAILSAQVESALGTNATRTHTGATVGLWRDRGQFGVTLPEPGEFDLRLDLLVKLDGETGHRRLAFGVPAALANRLALRLDESDAEIDFPGAVSLHRTSEPPHTRVDAFLGSGDRVELSWTPRVKRAAEVAATVFVEQAALVTIGGGVANIRSTLNYQVAQGEIRQLRLRLPTDHRLLRVTGETVRTWDFATNNPAELVVDLLRANGANTRLVLETERLLGTLPEYVKVDLPHPLDVRRVSGVVAARAGEDVMLTLDRWVGLQRVDAVEYARIAGEDVKDLQAAYRFARPDFDGTIRAEAIRPEIEAVARNEFILGTDQLQLSASLDYEARRLGAFTLEALLPAEGRIENVRCPAMQRWTERLTPEGRWLEIALKVRTLGKIPVQVTLRRALTQLPPTLALEGVHPVGVQKLSGTVIASAEAGVGIKPGTVEELVEAPVAVSDLTTNRPSGIALSFKFVSPQPRRQPAWRLEVATETIDSWVRAEVAHGVTLAESLVSGRTVVRYEIQNAPVRQFSLQLPPAWRHVEILGTGIRRRDQTNGLWTVELQNKAHGTYPLTVMWEQPRSNPTNDWQLAGFAVQKVERETGFVTLLTRPPLQIVPRSQTGEVSRIDLRELPDWAEVGSGVRSAASDKPVLAWRYLRPGFELGVGMERFADAAVLQALAENARLISIVADDGQLMTQLRLEVRHNGRQLLEVQVPPASTVWSAFVAGQPVRPRERDGRLLLPLQGNSDPDAPVAVEVTFVGKAVFPRAGGRFRIESPRLDVPVKDARWDLFLPPEYDYSDFGGSMTHAITDLAPAAQDFTLAEYRRQEAASAEADVAELKQVVERARSKLATGRLGDASDELGHIRRRQTKGGDASREVEQLEREFNRAQSSNFLQAQETFSYNNASRLAGPGEVGSSSQALKSQNRDFVEAAARQVEVLQKAQSVSVTRVQPLRVNLPTRGLRHSFSQVLQTEIGKPLTLEFEAQATRHAGVLRPLLTWVGGFLALWLLAAIALLFK